MPAHIHALPVSATNIMLKDSKGETYPITLDTDTFNRTGEDGDIPVLPLNGGDEFAGEILEGAWHKGWDSDIDTFTASIDSGILRLTGVAKAAGTTGRGWINSHHPLPLLDDVEVTFSMEVPVDDTGATANRDIFYYFFLKQDKNEIDPNNDNNYFRVYTFVDENGLELFIQKKVDGAITQLASGYDYTMDGNSSTGDLEATIWRLVFNGKPGTTGATMSVYLKQSDTLANAESATEHEVTGSPFNVSDLAFNVAYPAYRISTANTTYFGTAYDSANRAASGYLRVKYPPQFKTCYDFTPSDYGKADVCLFDGDPDGGGVRVYDEDHTFANDVYIQNSLIRARFKEATANYPEIYAYLSSTWTKVAQHEWIQQTSVKNLEYLHVLSIESISPEEIKLKIKWTDTATNDNDYYVTCYVTVLRGRPELKFEFIDTNPKYEIHTATTGNPTTRFGYTGDGGIGDVDLTISGNNTTHSDNFILTFDDDGNGVIISSYATKKPDNKMYSYRGYINKFQGFTYSDLLNTVFYIGLTYFSDIAHLFKEAEDATISASARLYLDGAGEDTVTENDGVWANTTNCAKDENNATNVSVGSVNLKITSSGAGAVVATCTPASPLGKLTKFDALKLYLNGNPDSDVTIRLKDSSGGDVSKTQAVTGSATQYTLDLPHSATDLQGWADNGFDFADFTTLTIEWTASGAGEIVYVDGLHEYIGTTTSRGRGETLSGGEAAVLDEINDRITYEMNPVSNYLPEGKYLLVWRLKDTDQVASDVNIRSYNNTESEYRNQENANKLETLSSSFGYDVLIVDIMNDDSGDHINHIITKNTATENTILVDYFLIVPISDGMNLPLDLAHNPLRSITQHPRLCIR